MKLQKRITMQDIAQELNISRTTVYRVLNGSEHVRAETKRRVNELIRKYNYYPNVKAQNLANSRAGTISIVIDTLIAPIWDEIIQGIVFFFNKKDYDVAIKIVNQTSKTALRDIIISDVQAGRSDALIIKFSSPFFSDPLMKELLYEIRATKFPLLFISALPAEEPFDFVAVNRHRGIKLVTQHLIKRGYSRIGYIDIHDPYLPAREHGSEKRKGYETAIRSGSAKPVQDTLIIGGDGYGFKEGLEIGEKIVAMSAPPDAIVCPNDILAVAIINKLTHAGIHVPEDIAVAGFNNDPQIALSPVPLTTVAQPVDYIVSNICRIISKKLEEPSVQEEQILLDPPLLIRRSTDPNQPSDLNFASIRSLGKANE